MRFPPYTGAALLAVSAAALVALGACSSTTSTASGTTPTTDVGAPAGPTRNTGAAVPAKTDTTPTPPSGAANSVNAVGSGTASLGTGVTPGSGEANSMQASGSYSTAALGGDAHIVSLLDVINSNEIAAGMLARQRATLPQVRAFANQMVQQHTQLQTQDRAVAKDPAFVAGDSAQVTRTLVQHGRDELAQLQQAQAGAAFDALYMTSQLNDHQQALTILNAAKQQARDGQVLKLVNAAIPAVQRHLNEAQQINGTLTAH